MRSIYEVSCPFFSAVDAVEGEGIPSSQRLSKSFSGKKGK
jgi:hypothetical protein